QAQRLMLLARLLSRESKVADAATFTRALAHLPEAELKEAADAMEKLQHVDDVETVGQLTHANSTAAEMDKVQRVVDKAEGIAALEQKLGGTLSESAKATLDAVLADGHLAPAQLRELCQALPDAEAQRFLEALAEQSKRFGGLAQFAPDFYVGLVRSPKSLAMFQ